MQMPNKTMIFCIATLSYEQRQIPRSDLSLRKQESCHTLSGGGLQHLEHPMLSEVSVMKPLTSHIEDGAR